MACEVKTFGKIRDFKKVQEYFGLAHDENWLNAINYAISPTGELIALGQGEKLALLSSCWDNKSQVSTYALTWCGELENPNQIITTIHCLPIYGKNNSSGPEWTCVALGLSSGMVVFYTDAGTKIFSQSCQEDPVLCIKSYTPPRHSEADSFVYVIYDQCICIVRGSEIYPLLTNLHHNLNRTYGRNSTVAVETADVLQYQKFKFSREREMIVNDAVVVSEQRSCQYDHIVQQCMGSGYYARISETQAQSTMVLGVGAEPYLGFYYAEEGYKTISLREVAKDVIGMAYKNIMGNLFRRTPDQSPSTEELPSPDKVSQMRTRCRIYDGKRDGFNIAIAPGGCLAAVTDNLDRVMLVDTQRAIIIRVWKGYRDAQCAFVPVKEKTLKGVKTYRRRALFLVIYAPRLGCLEIWALQNGPKVAAFTVSKSGQLAYNLHGLLGVKPESKVKAPINYCLFLDPSDGSVKEILIPFHFALSESNSSTSRDIHLLRRLRNLLRDAGTTQSVDDIAKLAAEFQTVEVRQQCLEMLNKNRQIQPETFQTIVCAFAESLAQQQEEGEFSEEQIQFQNLVQNYKRLVEFYIAIKSPIEVEFNEHLELQDCDLVIIEQLVLLLGNRTTREQLQSTGVTPPSANQSKVTFQEECKDDGDFVDYLSIFQVDLVDSIPLLRAKADSFSYISGKLFSAFFERGLCFEQLKSIAEQVKIPYEDLLVLVLHFWLGKRFDYQNSDEVIEDMTRLAAVVRNICDLAGDRANRYDYNDISPWWQEVREMLLESPKSLGLLVAIVCKAVAAATKNWLKESSADDSFQADEAERWEQITHDQAQWGLLIGKLEDIAILGAILEYPIKSVEPVMPEVSYEAPECSLKFIVNGGRGIVTDLTSQWLINSRIHPSKIVEPNEEEETIEITANINENDKKTDTKNEMEVENEIELEQTSTTTAANSSDDVVLAKLKLLREHYPFSLESGVLLSLMSWQYMVHWSKNLTSFEHMRAALTCLAQFKQTDLALKHGICCMLWNATLKYPLQSTMKLIQKAGRLPKDKMCQQDIEMSAANVPDFLELSIEFLGHFDSSLNHDKRELKFEESLTDGQLPLQFLALQQHHAIKELLQLHYELCAVLHFIAVFQLKIHKPITHLFDAMSNKSFFADINKELTYLLPAPDIVLQQNREEFLCKVISTSMDSIREDLQKLFVQEHMDYMERVNVLADSWKLDKNALRRRQVVEMYAHGYDEQAQLLLKDVRDDEHIGRVLLEIAGKRLSLYTSKSQSAYLKMASVGPQLLNYLDNLNETTTNSIQIIASDPEEIDIDALSRLLNNLFKHLSPQGESSKYVHIAAQMFDAVSFLQE